MKPHFLFPASPLNPRVIDEVFFDQAVALKSAGFGASSFSIEANRVNGSIPDDAEVIYRGWMMTAAEYEVYESWLAGAGHKAFTSRHQYLATHYLPNWYPLLERYTVNSVVFPGDSELMKRDLQTVAFHLEEFVRSMQGLKKPPFNADNGLPWDKFQLKDYVKSLKTDGGSAFTTPEEILPILEKMQKYRGVIEGGVVIRQWEKFVTGSEKRYFVINGHYYAQEGAFDLRHMRILARVHEVVPSPFYSVDIAQPADTDLEARLVEIGDGQVSDLVGWTPERFAEIWKEASA